VPIGVQVNVPKDNRDTQTISRGPSLEEFLEKDEHVNKWCNGLRDTYCNINQIKSFSTSMKRKQNSKNNLPFQIRTTGTSTVKKVDDNEDDGYEWKFE